MNRKERTFILCHAPEKDVVAISKNIETTHNIEFIKHPSSGLVMIDMRDSAQLERFYLGEVLVTECKVKINNAMGLGLVRGYDVERSRAMAIIDAAYELSSFDTTSVDDKLSLLGEEISKQRKRESAYTLKTKVDFSTLDEEVKS